MLTRTVISSVMLMTAGTGAGAAQAPDARVPRALEGIEACRKEQDDAARLRCFDTAAATLSRAATAREVVVLDRAEVRETRRNLFGFALPRVRLFGGTDAEESAERIETLESTVAAWRGLPDGRYQIQLAEGGTWATTEPMRGVPAEGAKVSIRAASLGSYLLSVNGRRSARAMRVR